LFDSSNELISRLDSRTLRTVNVQGLLVFSNNVKNSGSDIGDIKHRIMASPRNLVRSLKMTAHWKWWHSIDDIRLSI